MHHGAEKTESDTQAWLPLSGREKHEPPNSNCTVQHSTAGAVRDPRNHHLLQPSRLASRLDTHTSTPLSAAMRTTTAIAALLAASAGVSAASSAHPVLAFTSQQASSIHLELPTDSSLTGLIDSLYAAGRASPACQLDAIALVQAEHLDRDTFASLRHSSTDSLRARSLDAPSQVTFNAAPAEDAFGYLNSAKKVCGYKSYQLLNSSGLGQFSADATATGKPVFAEFQAGDIRQQGECRGTFRLL